MKRLKIVWLKTGPLHPVDTGGKIRTYQMVRELNRRHEVTYVSLLDPDESAASRDAAVEYSRSQVWIPWHPKRKGSPSFYAEVASNVFSTLPYIIARYRSEGMTTAIQQLEATWKPDLIVCDFLTPAVNLPSARTLRTPVLLFEHNVESMIWQRLAENASGLKRAYFSKQAQRMERFERDACQRCAGVVTVSEDDAVTLRTKSGLTNVLGAVPTGVDTTFYAPTEAKRAPESLVFLGSMDWMPNIDGACWFVEEILPLIRQQHPRVTLSIVGRNPVARVLELAAKNPHVHVTGTVPDVRPHLAKAEVLIVPLRIGGGTRIKIYEGMATGIPVVATPIGAEGLPLTDGKNIRLGASAVEFAGAVNELLADKNQRQQIGDNGLAFVRSHCSWAHVTDIFEQYCIQASHLSS